MATSAAAADSEYTIKLLTGDIVPAPMRGVPSAAAALEGKHILVQFEGPVTDSRKYQLSGRGIELLDFVPNFAYTARLNKAVTQETMEDFGIRFVGPLKPEYKISPMITELGIAEWARRGDDRVQFAIVIHPDEDIDDWASTFERDFGAEVIGTVPFSGVIDLVADEMMYYRFSELDAVVWIEQAMPYPVEFNNSARLNTGADIVQEPPFSLTGSGIVVAEWDGGRADQSHPDLGTRRVHSMDNAGLATHATHVAGTVMGTGEQSAGLYRGMAPGAELATQLWWSSSSEMSSEYAAVISAYGASVSTNSWGYGVDPVSPSNCASMLGNYFSVNTTIDNLVRGAAGAPITICWSAGNQRSHGSDYCGSIGWEYNTVTALPSAKNVITIGAITSFSDAMTSFSSWGPTDDGRIKPDVVGPGYNITSCRLTSGYTTMSGTSMSCPAVAGVVALLQEQYNREIGGGALLSSTVRGILINTAIDLGNTGPDYSYGNGKVNAVGAATKMGIGEPSWVQDEMSTGETDVYDITVTGSAEVLKVTLVWDDPGGIASSSQALKNDLDLILIDPFDSERQPWVLNPSSPSAPATRGEDHLNNVETVEVVNPVAGLWKAAVRGYNVPYGPQSYSLIFTPDSSYTPGNLRAVAAYPGGDVSADPGTPATVEFWVSNVGEMFDSLQVQINDDSLWLQSTVDTVVYLNPYDSAYFVLLADVPGDAPAGLETHVTCHTASLTSPQAVDQGTVTVSASAVYVVSLTTPPEDTVTSPDSYWFETTVGNEGNATDVITVTPDDELGWSFMPPSQDVPLASLTNTVVGFTVSVPPEVPDMAVNHVTLVAESSGDAADTVVFPIVAENGVFPPTLVSPEPVVYTGQRVHTFEWSSEPSVSYNLYIATNAQMSSPVRLYTGIPGTTFAMPQADSLADDTYFWAVRRYVEGDSSSLQLSPREIVVDNQAPADPIADWPSDVYVKTKIFTFAFSESVTGPFGDAPEFALLQLSQDPDFVAGVFQYDSISSFSMELPDPTDDGRWFWRVQRFDLADNFSAFSSGATFVIDTEAPALPTLVLPENDAVLDTDSVSIIWRPDQPAPHEESPEYYYLHVSNRPDFVDFSTFQGYIWDTVKVLPPSALEEGRTYWWRAKAFDSAGFSTEYSQPFSFGYHTFTCGDVDGNREGPDIGDLTYLIGYLFVDGPEPVPYEAGSVDCDELVDIGDVTYLIGFLFIDGPDPCCQ
ncbi:MAG TPA: S8 family serine peptidase [Acidobacteriota bacterium]|nr:S8 family serine peptidase [Acidobacteriota bacterium]